MIYFNNKDASAKYIPSSKTDGISPVIALAAIIAPLVAMMLIRTKKRRTTYSQESSKRSDASNLAFFKGRSLNIPRFLRGFS